MKGKILISDYDQTFYINDEDIEKNKLLVKKFRTEGNIFVFATGRSYEDFKNAVNKYSLEYDYAIINHGATVLNEEEQIISSKTNKSNAINILLNYLEASKEKVYVIGDGYSDIEMIKDFSGYAMQNCVEELKEMAKKQYNSVSELIKEII